MTPNEPRFALTYTNSSRTLNDVLQMTKVSARITRMPYRQLYDTEIDEMISVRQTLKVSHIHMYIYL